MLEGEAGAELPLLMAEWERFPFSLLSYQSVRIFYAFKVERDDEELKSNHIN